MAVIYFVVYKLVIVDTKNLYYEFVENKKLNNNIDVAPDKVINLKSKIDANKLRFLNDDSTSTSEMNKLIEFAEEFKIDKKIEVVELTDFFQNNNNEFKITYHQLTVGGDFFNLMEFLISLEEQYTNSGLVSCSFYVAKNKKTNKLSILSKYYFQKVNKDEKANKTI